MSEPNWVRQDIAIAIHEHVVVDHGGKSGIRDSGLLESALARPQQIHACDASDLATLAAAYAAGIHPFLDGSKRVGFMLAYLFLACNSVTLTAAEASATRAVLDLTAGDTTEAQFAQWLRDHTEPTGK